MITVTTDPDTGVLAKISLTFCNIFLITEDIYVKLGKVVHYKLKIIIYVKFGKVVHYKNGSL